MTSFISAVRKLIQRRGREPTTAALSRVEFSYTIYWTKMMRAWDGGRRAAAASALARVLARPDFAPNEYERRYMVPGLDDQAHSGQSLLALRKVLQALEVFPEH